MGGHLVEELALDPEVARVVAPCRRPDLRWPAWPKVEARPLDLGRTDGAAPLICDQVFLCLGTTLRKAGSREAFRAVDLEAVAWAARLAVEGGARDAFLVSSLGADPGSRSFYLEVKGRAEEAVGSLPFRSVHVFRPSILTGARRESRPAERMGIVVGTLAAPLLRGPLRRYRPIAGGVVARAMAAAARCPGSGLRVHESEEIAALGA